MSYSIIQAKQHDRRWGEGRAQSSPHLATVPGHPIHDIPLRSPFEARHCRKYVCMVTAGGPNQRS